MSWQAYIDDQLIGTGFVTKAAICGLQGGIWATSPGFSVSDEEIKALVSGFNDATQLQTSGFKLDGQKYFFQSADNNKVVRGKHGPSGATVAKTQRALIVGVYSEGIQPGQCNTVVEKLADWLSESGY